MDAVNQLLKAVNGGWASVAVIVLLAIGYIWFKIVKRKAEIEKANKETQEQRQQDQADTVTENQDAQAGWNQAENELKKERNKEVSKKKKKRSLQ